MDLFVGTSGFSYKEWKGSFYPEDLPAKKMLSYYAQQLPAVEINNTFYRLPRAEVLASWAEQVPDGFRFVLKASRRITHFKRLKPESLEEARYLAETAQTLGDRLGLVMFQLPPNFKCDLERLETFLDGLPGSHATAFEFRHDSWLSEEVDALLGSHGVARVVVDTDEKPAEELARTADWGYLRLRGTAYSEDDLSRWRGAILESGWKAAYVFFKHEDEGTGPRFAASFLDSLRSVS